MCNISYCGRILNNIFTNRLNKEDLIFVEKELVAAINNLAEIKRTLNDFLVTNLFKLKKIIKESDQMEAHCGSSAYLPMFHVNELDVNLKHVRAGSGYLDNEIIKVISYSGELNVQMKDIRLQFENTVSDAKHLATNKINSYEFHNSSYLRNIENYEEMIKRDVVGKNIYTYLKALTKTYVTSMEIRKLGKWRWRQKFSSSFKFFLNKKKHVEYKKDAIKRVDEYINPILEEKYEEFLTNF